LFDPVVESCSTNSGVVPPNIGFTSMMLLDPV